MGFLTWLGGLIATIFTGGKYGTSVRTDRSRDYAKRQEQRAKEFAQFGAHECKICRTRIPANKTYCGACFHTYIKK